jgi:hypothetical protein
VSALWHVGERGDIALFEPRTPGPSSPAPKRPVVWAVDEAHLDAYLLPRDCPRMCFRRTPRATAADVERFFGASTAQRVVVIEAGWFARAVASTLWLYALPTEDFVRIDANAGYFTAFRPVRPLRAEALVSPLNALLSRGTELRVVPTLRPVAAAVAASSLAFSVIRLRNATGA